jgi:AraC family transcriptional regulator
MSAALEDTASPDRSSRGPRAIHLADCGEWVATEKICCAGPTDRPFEEHRDGFAIAAVVEGTFNYRTDTGKALLYPGAILLGNHATCFACGHEHSRGDRCVALQVRPEFVAESASALGGGARFSFDAPMLPALNNLRAPLLRMLTGVRRREPLARDETVASFIEQVIQIAARGSPRVTSPSNADQKRISRVLHAMDTDFHEPIELAGLAALAGMSKYHFLRTFQRVTGVTPYQHLIGLRLRRAVSRLIDSSAPVAEIAYAAGFGDLSTFHSTFRAHFGESPGAFRRRHA